MNELSIFIDESGDFGEYDYHSPFYIIAMVFHDQKNDIQNSILSKSEIAFFGNIRDLNKNYLKQLGKKEWI